MNEEEIASELMNIFEETLKESQESKSSKIVVDDAFFNDFTESLAELSRLLDPVVAFVIGHRNKLVDGGINPGSADGMAHDIHSRMIAMLWKAVV